MCITQGNMLYRAQLLEHSKFSQETSSLKDL